MAYTRIHSIKRTVDKSLDYIKNEKKTTFIGGKGSKDDLQRAMQYIANAKKTTSKVSKEYRFVEGWQCDPQFATYQFEETKKKYLEAHGGRERNTTGTPAMAFHFIQSFGPEVTDPVIVHNIGMELAEKIGDGGYQCVVASHIEGSHVLHNHIICNAYPIDPYGHKYHRSVAEYQKIRQLSDEIGLKYGIEPIWDDDDNDYQMRPDTVEVNVFDGDSATPVTATNDNWTSVTAGKRDKTYTVSEIDSVENYTSVLTKTSVDENGNMQFIITHTLDKSKIERRNIAVTLNNVWNDESDLYNMRPNKLRTRLMRNNKKYAEVEACDDKGWCVEFANVPVVGDYTIEVTTPKGYTTEVKIDSIDENGNIKVTATHELNENSTLQTIKIKLDNIWNDNDDATHRRPAYLKVMLKRNGVNCFDEPVTVKESNNWSYTADKVPKLGTYTAEVTSPTGYLTTVTADDISDGVMTIKAEHNLKTAPKSTNLVAKVVWNDNNNAAGKRPDSIKIDIQQDGKSIHAEPQPITKDKDWAMTVLGVKKDATYTAKVSRVVGYDAAIKDAVVNDEQTMIEIVYTMKEEAAPTPAPTEAPKPTEKPSEPEQTKVESKTEEKTPAPENASKPETKVVIETNVKPTGVSFLASLFGK